MNLTVGAVAAIVASVTALYCPPAPPQAPPASPATIAVVDGFVIGHVPAGVGPQTSNFEYEWEDVTFRSQVWERGPDADGAFAVDLTVKVLRSARLVDLEATAAFLAEYHEQDRAGWTPFDHHGQPGHHRPGSVFWWVADGVAVEVSLDEGRFTPDDLTATALGVRAEG